MQQQHSQQSNIMLTPLDKISQQPSVGTTITEDMADDPIVKDVLSEFEKELLLNENQANNYNINYQQQPQQPQQQQQQQQPQYQPQQPLQQPQLQQQQKQNNINKYIDNILLTKTFIICIIVAFITNPYIYNTIISKVPENFSALFESYNYFIKLGLIFIAVYLFYYYKLV